MLNKQSQFVIYVFLCIFVLLDIVEGNDFSQSSRNEIENLSLSLSHISPLDMLQGEFKVEDTGVQLEIFYYVKGDKVFNRTISKKKFYEAIPIKVGGYSTLFLNAYGLRLRYPYSYLIYPNPKSNTFTFYDFRRDSAEVKYLGSDSEAEIVSIEFIDWIFNCFPEATRPDWHRIFHLFLPQNGDITIIDVSSSFPIYYSHLYDEYTDINKELSPEFPTVCYSNFQKLIKTAKNLAKNYSSNSCELRGKIVDFSKLGWVNPLEKKYMYISSCFLDPNYEKDFPCRTHIGIDLKAQANSIVKSICKGSVIGQPSSVIKDNVWDSRIVIKCDEGFSVVYGHITNPQISLNDGKRVEKDIPIAMVGNMGGNSHLHFGINIHGDIYFDQKSKNKCDWWGFGQCPNTEPREVIFDHGWVDPVIGLSVLSK